MNRKEPTDSSSGESSHGWGVDPAVLEQFGETAFFRALVENAADGLFTIDESSTILFANPAIERIFGYPPETLLGESLLTLIPEYLRDRYTAILAQHLEIEKQNLDWTGVELAGLHEDGRTIDLSLSFREVERDGQPLFIGIVRDITERNRRQRELERYKTTVDAVGDGIYQLDLNGRYIAVNDVITEVSGFTRDELIGEHVSTLVDEEGVQKSTDVIHQLLTDDSKDVGVVEFDVHTADGSVIPVEDRIALLWSGDAVAGTVGVVRDISERKRREAELERQRDELAELNRINAVIRDINQTLVGATTREEVEETVCDRLAGSDSYVFVWICERSPGSNVVRPTRWSGVSEENIENVTIAADDRPTDEAPTARAFRTGEIAVARNVEDVSGSEPGRDEGRANDVCSLAAVPIRYGDTVYGALNIYADRRDAFDERERNVLAELGETIGLAINAVESKKLLHADTVVELEFRITGAESFFVDASDELGCTLRLEGLVPAADGTFLYYVSLVGASPDSLVELAENAPNVDGVTVVNEHDGESLLLFKVSGSSAVLTFIEAGARVNAAIAENGSATVTVHVAPDADVSTIVETVERAFPTSELVARREIQRPVQTQRVFREVVRGRLTDRQRAVLEAAYRGSYFARPRDISGDTLAESFDVTPSTFHHHLQTALNKVVAAVFDDSSEEHGSL